MDSTELMTFATHVLERVLQKSGYMPEPAAGPSRVLKPSDMFIDSLAEKVVAFVKRADAGIAANGTLAAAHEQLRARNTRMALAVGACECFGEDGACSTCHGEGGPGWQVPRRSPFEEMVRPAMRRVEQLGLSTRNGRMHAHQQ